MLPVSLTLPAALISPLASTNHVRHQHISMTATAPSSKGKSWPLNRIAFSLLPLAGAERRATVECEVVRGRVWTYDQIQGVLNVNVNVRMTVVKLEGGGLWVHNPVAPTAECLSLIHALESKHGCVEHIVLGTLGLEHKALAGPFSRYDAFAPSIRCLAA